MTVANGSCSSQRAKATLPAVKMLQLAEVSTPDSQNQESQMTEHLDRSHPVFDFFEQRSVLVNTD